MFPSRRAGDSNALAHPLASPRAEYTSTSLSVLVCKRANRRYIAAARWLTPSWKRRSQERNAARSLIDPDASRRSDVNSRQRAALLKGNQRSCSALWVFAFVTRGAAAFLNGHRISATL
ncbi:hypothetical protein QQF64_034875 [Cirrhinus molitorella]|uniref:Uncharacterized protein n=1 Tax=Cirrhinus molitorella TaxID=172907 RepID=A0ABR3NE58_9TELE